MSAAVPDRWCVRGQHFKPATIEYFHLNPNTKDGFHSWCKVCTHTYYRDRRNAQRREQLEQNNGGTPR